MVCQTSVQKLVYKLVFKMVCQTSVQKLVYKLMFKMVCQTSVQISVSNNSKIGQMTLLKGEKGHMTKTYNLL